jgi:uracil-DNA glycosylase family 4
MSVIQLRRKPPAPAAFDPRSLGANCDVCPLKNCKPVPSTIIDNPKFVVLGEAPGRLESLRGEVFVGPTGKLLEKTLSKYELKRKDAALLNTILCRNDSDKDMAGAMVACAPRLMAELRQLPEDVPILSLGAFAAKALLGVSGILKTRGFVWRVPTLAEKDYVRLAEKADDADVGDLIKMAMKEKRKKPKKKVDLMVIVDGKKVKKKSKNKTLITPTGYMKVQRQILAGRMVLPTLHPAFVLRDEIWGSLLNLDVERLSRVLAAGINRFKLEDQKPFLVVSSASELLKQSKSLPTTVTVDIETDSPDPLLCRLVCVGLGTDRKRIIAYPWKTKMVKALSEILSKRTSVMHNGIIFDAPVLERYGVKLGRIEDTLVAHHAFASHLPKSLLQVASVYTDASPWKHAAKGEAKGEKGLPHQLTPDELARYNAADVGLTDLSWHRMQADLEDELDVYEIDMRIAQMCANMRISGFPFDVDRARVLGKTLQARKNALLGLMRDLTRMPYFSPSKPDDIRKALFGRFHSPLITPTPTGLASTSRAILEQLRSGEDKAGRLSDLILRWRDAAKTKSTYLGVFVHEDGRVHENWRIGPVTGRLACRLMTLPRYVPDKHGVVDPTDCVRECYVAKPGYTLVYFDLSQAEMRMAAWLSQDPVFMHACKGDVHAGNARVLFPEAVAEGMLIDDKAAKTIGAKFRNIAKNAGFAVTYLAGWETVYAYLTSHGFPEVSARDCKAMLDRLHTAYRGYFRYVDNNIAFVRRCGHLRSLKSRRIRWLGQYAKPTEIANTPVQTGIADFMNERLPLVEDRLPSHAALIAQIHDAGIFHVRNDQVKSVNQIIDDVYGPPIEADDGRAPLVIPTDKKTGERWSALG